MRVPLLLVVVALVIAQAVLCLGLRAGPFFNSYPFITNDGFDLIYQGYALADKFSGISSKPWPILRSPLLVILGAIDLISGVNGAVLILAQSLGLSLALIALYWLGSTLGLPQGITALYLLAFTLNPLGELRLYILTDTLASGLMAISTVSMIIYSFHHKLQRYLALAAVTALLAGFLQIYGLIPFLVLSILHLLHSKLINGQHDHDCGRYLLFVVVFFAFSIYFWQKVIPHLDTPTQFGYLKPDLEMLDFYLNTWGFTFGPLIPLAAILFGMLLIVPLGYSRISSLSSWLALLVSCFMLITFFYHWRESRFTFVYLPVVFIFLMALQAELALSPKGFRLRAPLNNLATLSLAGYILWTILAVPQNLWQPELKSLAVNPQRSWPMQLVRAKPRDIFSLSKSCGTRRRFCADATLPEGDGYRTMMLKLLLLREQVEERAM